MIDNNILQAISKGQACSGAGFFIHHDSAKNKFYGFFINEDSEALLLTKAYVTERHCENALQRFREGRFVTEGMEGEGGFYTEFRTEGGKPLAWGPVFAEKAEAEAAARQVKGEKPEQEPLAAAASEPAAYEGAPPRHSFRLDFYRAGGKGPARGRIEYALTQESASFQGLDMGFVRSFIARHLDKAEGPEDVGPAVNGSIKVFENGRPAGPTIFLAGQPLEVELEAGLAGTETYDAFVYASPLENNNKMLVGRKQGAGGPVRLPVLTPGLTSGLYRFTATVHVAGGQGKDYSFTSSLLQLFAGADAGVEVEGF